MDQPDAAMRLPPLLLTVLMQGLRHAMRELSSRADLVYADDDDDAGEGGDEEAEGAREEGALATQPPRPATTSLGSAMDTEARIQAAFAAMMTALLSDYRAHLYIVRVFPRCPPVLPARAPRAEALSTRG